MGLFRKSIDHSKSSKNIDQKIKNLDEELKKTGITTGSGCAASFPSEEKIEQYEEFLLEEQQKAERYDWRTEIVEEDTEEDITEEVISEVREKHNYLATVEGSIDYVKGKEVKSIFNELYRGEVESVVEEYVCKSSHEIVSLREELFNEISKVPKVDVQELENRLNLLAIKYNRLCEDLENQADPALDNPVNIRQLRDHYQMMIGRLQEQLATVGGGGEVRIEFLDDLDRDTALVDGTFLRYNASINKWVGTAVVAGQQTLDATLELGNVSTRDINVGVVSATSVKGDGRELTVLNASELHLGTIPDDRFPSVLPAVDGSNLTNLSDATPNTYGGSTVSPVITVGANGRITGITNVLIEGGFGGGGGSGGVIVRDNGFLVGVAGTIDFGDNIIVSPVSAGIVTVSVNGISTAGLASQDYVDNKVGLSTVDLTNQTYVDDKVGLATVNLTNQTYVDNKVGLATVGLASQDYVGLQTFTGDYNNLTNKPTIPTNNNQLTNGAGYITGYTVTQGDVTAHEAALTITESQISDFGTYATVASVGLATAGLASQSFVGLATAGLASEAFVGLATVGLASEDHVGLATANLTNQTYVDNKVGLATVGLASEEFVGLSTAGITDGLLSSTGSAANLTDLTGASAATYGNTSAVPQIVVDSNGRITSIENVLISTGGGSGAEVIIRDSGSVVGTAGTIDFDSNLSVTPVSAGIVTVSVSGISTAGLASEDYVGTQLGLATSGLASEVFVGLATSGLASEAFVGLATSGLASETFVGLSTAGISTVGLASEEFVGLATAGITDGLLSTTGSAANLTGLTGASAATYGNSTAVPQIVVDSNGRITSIANVLVSASGGGGTSLVVKDSGSLVGTAGTIDFSSNLSVSPVSAGIVTVSVTGISTSGLASEDYVGTQLGLATSGLASEDYVGTQLGLATTGLASEAFVGLSTVNLTNQTYVDNKVGLATSGLLDTNGVDLHLNTSSAAVNQVLGWNGSDYDWVNQSSGGGGTLSYASKTVSFYTATSLQTTFNATYTVGYVDVYVNGVKLSESEYIATNGTSIVLNTGATSGDIVEIIGFEMLLGGVEVRDSGSFVGTAATILDFGSNLSVTSVSSGIVTVSAGGGSTAEVRSNTLVVSGVSTFGNNVRIEGTTQDETTLTLKNTSISGNVSAINFEAANSGITTSRILFDWYGSEYDQSHGMNYVSGRGGFWQNHWFRNGEGDVQLSIRNDGKVAIGSHTPAAELDVDGNARVGAGLTVVGVSTFANAVDINNDLDVDGHTELDNLNVSGVSTFAGNVSVSGLTGGGAIVYSTGSGTLGDTANLSYSGDRLDTVSLRASGDLTVVGDASVGYGLTVVGVATASSFVRDGGTSSQFLMADGSVKSRTREVVSGTTASIADNVTDNINITGFKAYTLMKVGLSTAGWLRLYTDSASRTADAGRSIGEDPTPGSGVIAEVVTTGISTTQVISPFVMGGNMDDPATTTMYVAITNTSGSTQTITANLTILQLED